MRLTATHGDSSGCNDGTCPTIYDTDDPELVVVQGALLIDPEALADLGQIPGHERVIVFPRAQLARYVTEENGRDDTTIHPDRSTG